MSPIAEDACSSSAIKHVLHSRPYWTTSGQLISTVNDREILVTSDMLPMESALESLG
jgi:hypothetical protein